MLASDRLATETAEAKNSVESYTYGMREKLTGTLAKFVAPSDAQIFAEKLNAANEWLYDQPEDTTKGVFVSKLKELKVRL